MSFIHLHSLLRGAWLLDKSFAEAQLPLVMRLMNGEAVNFNFSDKVLAEEKLVAPSLIQGFAAANVFSAGRYTDVSELPENSVLVYTVAGPMVKRGGMCASGMVDHANAINNFRSSKNVAGLILDSDSPGGQASGTSLLGGAVKSFASEKPLISMINDGMSASAMYWINSGSTEIYTTQATDKLGSIGVYTTIADWNAHYKDKMKLPVMDVYAPQSTDKNGDYRSAIAGDTSALEQDLSVLADQFINTVAENRGSKLKGKDWATGKMFYSADAQKQGLTDGQKSFGQIVERMNNLIGVRKKSASNSSTKYLNKMAFEKVLVAAKATQFAVVEGGFMLSEDNLNNVEAAVTAGEKAAADMVKASEQVQSLTKAVTEAGEATKASATTISNLTTKVTELEGQVAALGKQSSGKGTVITTAKDATTGEQKSEHRFAGDDWAESKAAGKPKTDYSKLMGD